MEEDIKGKLAGNKITAKRLNVEERGSLEAASKCLGNDITWKFERGSILGRCCLVCYWGFEIMVEDLSNGTLNSSENMG